MPQGIANRRAAKMKMDPQSLWKRPAIFVIGSANVGKRTLLSRLLGIDFGDTYNPSHELLVHGWTIDTKYYTADVSVWMAHLNDELSTSPIVDRAVALVMVFDINNVSLILHIFPSGMAWLLCFIPSSLAALKDWVSRTEIQNFDILLCIGNKVDLLPDHPAHMEYKRRLMKRGESSICPPLLGSSEYGISETEGSTLLGDEDPTCELKTSCLEWCLEHNIEYVEACASNAEFDKCLSVDGDSQGVDRLHGALSAHMWAGMLLKSGGRINEPSLPDREELSGEESDYEAEYEKLSCGSAEAWDDVGWMSSDGPERNLERDNNDTLDRESEVTSVGEEYQASSALTSRLAEEIDKEEATPATDTECDGVLEADFEDVRTYDFEDLEKMVGEIGNMRNGLRLMADFQRREMAAKLAMKMAAMFGDSSSSSGGEDDNNEKI